MGTWKSHNNDKQTEQGAIHPEMNCKQNNKQLSYGQKEARIKKGMKGKHNETQRPLSTKYNGTPNIFSRFSLTSVTIHIETSDFTW